jgi:hypothetical protein
MRLCSLSAILAALGCVCGSAIAKPEPDAATLKFIAACIRYFTWPDDYYRPGEARRELSHMDGKSQIAFLRQRREARESRSYLEHLSHRAFKRHLADALYLTTPRGTPRYCVAYAAAMRGQDVMRNCARLQDVYPQPGERDVWKRRNKLQLWERTLVDKVLNGAYLTPNEVCMPSYLANVYDRHPDERILRFIFDRPSPDGEGAMCLSQAIGRLAADHTTAVLRFACRKQHDFGWLRGGLSGYLQAPLREKARRHLHAISRSGGSIASAATLCLTDMARWDEMIAKQDRAAKS